MALSSEKRTCTQITQSVRSALVFRRFFLARVFAPCPRDASRNFVPARLWFRGLAIALLLAPFLLNAQSNSFRFAWLSDTHVGATTGEEDLRASVRDINSLTGISFVVISGDVTEYGSREQLRLAKEILDGLHVPCHVVPGNHDTKWSESGATDFPRLWKEDRFVFEYGGFRFIGMHEGPIMKMGDGHWAPQDVRWLEKQLTELPDKNQPLIFITHYPIDDGIDNWYVVLDLLKKYNTQAALCGHIHRNNHASFEGLPGVMGRSNLRANAAVGGYTLVEVKNGTAMTFSERHPGGNTKAPWYSVSLQRHDFSADPNHYSRPDFSTNAHWPQVKERWQHSTGFTIASTPALWKQTVIVADASGMVYGLALSSGAVDWKFKTQGAVYSTPDVSGDTAVFASTDGSIYAVNAADGKQLWRYKTDRPIVASAKIAETRQPNAISSTPDTRPSKLVFVGSSEGKFRALNLADGKLAWEFDGLGGFVETKPLVFGDKVIFAAWDQQLYALDAATGKLVWKWKGDKAGVLFSPAACWPIAADGRVFIVAPDRRMTAIDASTGTQIWRTGDYMVRESIGLSEDQTRFYVRAMQDFIYAFATTGPQPQKIWETKPGFGYDINSAMLVEKGGVVFYGTKNGLLYALDGHSGETKWQHRIGVGIVNTVLPLSSTEVLATDSDGKVTLVEAKQ